MKDWNSGVIEEFHAKGGKGVGRWGDRLLLLTVRSRSEKTKTYPLAFHKDGDRYIVAASKGGAPTNPDWYRNLVAHRDVTVEVGGEKFAAKATPLPNGPERDRLWETHATLMPGFRDYVMKTTRIIPVVLLERVA